MPPRQRTGVSRSSCHRSRPGPTRPTAHFLRGEGIEAHAFSIRHTALLRSARRQRTENCSELSRGCPLDNLYCGADPVGRMDPSGHEIPLWAYAGTGVSIAVFIAYELWIHGVFHPLAHGSSGLVRGYVHKTMTEPDRGPTAPPPLRQPWGYGNPPQAFIQEMIRQHRPSNTH